MRTGFLSLIAGLAWCSVAIAAPNFPALTGRVVDNAHILSPQTQQSLEQSLAQYEAGTSNQVVVVTLADLGGDSIEDYGYQLGRHWQIGQKDKNNGVLLIIAPKEHKVRIEVGYGLEPVLTDAATSEIVNAVILPDFRAGHMEQGVVDGTNAILSVLGGKSAPTYTSNAGQAQPITPLDTIITIIGLIAFLIFAVRHPFIAMWLQSSSMRSGSSRMGGWGGGGFSGGGGSFGGGGASGGW